MPNFLPPTVDGPVSTENTYVVVKNQQPNTTLKVYANRTTVIGTKDSADGGEDKVPIDPAYLPLTTGTALTATQEDPSGGPPSNPSPVPVVVQAVPNPLGQGRFEGMVYSCVKFLRVSGLTPGATFEIHQPAGTVIGTGDTYSGRAEVRLTQTVKSTDPLILRQKAGGQSSDAQYPMPIVPVPLPEARKLRQLTIRSALDCDYYLDVEGTINGVEVDLTRTRSGTATERFGFGFDNSTRFWVPETFRAHDVLSAIQRMEKECEINPSDPSPAYEVQPDKVDPPQIIPPVCLDALRLQLINMRPGADYAVYAVFKTASGDRQQLIGCNQFPKKDPLPYIDINPVTPPPDQLPGTVPSLFINQTACGWTSEPSPAVAMEPLGSSTTPRLPDPLYACAVFVRVADVRPGSWVSVHSRLRGGNVTGTPAEWLGGEIGRAQARDAEVSVFVPPGLIEGDTVWACATGCQNEPTHSAPSPVLASKGVLQAEIVGPVYPTDTVVQVRKLVTGARVIARVSGPNHPGGKEFYYSYAWAPDIPVYVGQLFEDDEITIFQSLCHKNATENQSHHVKVILGTMDASIAPVEALKGTNTRFFVPAIDPQRQNTPVSGDVSFGGVKVGQTNAGFWWQGWDVKSVPVQVTAAGYQPWQGSISVISYFNPTAGASYGSRGSSTPPLPYPGPAPTPSGGKKAFTFCYYIPGIFTKPASVVGYGYDQHQAWLDAISKCPPLAVIYEIPLGPNEKCSDRPWP